METNEVIEKQCIKCKINKSFEKRSHTQFKQQKKKGKNIMVKCDKCLKDKMLKDIVTRTEFYKKKYYKKQICLECFPTFEKEHTLTEQKKSLNYRIKKTLAWRLRHILVKTNTTTTMDYIGCNIQYVREWLEYNFTNEMNWDNYDTFWSIDHVIPVCKFDLTIEDEKFKCCNWSNLIPVQNLAPPLDVQRASLKVDKIKKFKEEGSTTKWFSSEFILNKDLALMKEK
jgi:hypothetical protein